MYCFHSFHKEGLVYRRYKLEYTAEYQLLIISLASNIPGHKEPNVSWWKGRVQRQHFRLWRRLWSTENKTRQESQWVGVGTLYATLKLIKRNLRARISTTITIFTSQHVQAGGDSVGESTGFDKDSDDESEDDDEGRRGSSPTNIYGPSTNQKNLSYQRERRSSLGWGRARWAKKITPSAREPGQRKICAPSATFWVLQ